ncbi:hypothetical protein LXA43DRAFT_1097964 [Ganoderma leucocontextum]|nr:hypothetical protein LXA43DRAFT_1097964 [Ganoderma leucocontextum]
MTTARPNEDILAIACEFITGVSNVLSFALTCSALRPVATQRLLSMRSITLKIDPSVRRFHSFLFADTPARAPHIRAVTIGLESKDASPAIADVAKDTDLLIDILTACPHLERISLLFYGISPQTSHDARVMDAIAALPSLRSLTVYGPSEDALTLVSNIRAPLRVLILHQCGAGETEFWHPAALEEFLSHLAPTLEKLTLYELIADEDVLQALGVTARQRPGSGATQFPAVRSLSIGMLLGMPLLSHLQYLFPALDGTLSIGQFIFEDEEQTDTDSLQPYVDLRAANLRAQGSLSDALVGDGSGSLSSCAWTKLDRVVCGALFFYLLGLRCPVRLVMLDFTIGHSLAFTQAAMRAAEALRENPVPRLKFSLVLNDGLDVFDALFSPELAGTLTHLTLSLSLANDTMWSDMADAGDTVPLRWDDLLDKLHSAFQLLHKLTHLRIVVHSNAFDDSAPELPPAAHSQEFVHALCGPAFDHEGSAAALVRSLPALRYVFLTTSGYLPIDIATDDESTGGGRGSECSKTRELELERERRQDGEPALVELHDDVAETIIRNEELILSDLDKAWMNNGVIETDP